MVRTSSRRPHTFGERLADEHGSAGVGLFMLWVFGGRGLTKRTTSLLFMVILGTGVWQIVDIRRSAQSGDVLSNHDVIWHFLIPYLHNLPIFGYGPNLFRN